jgi:hypothetical protein
MSLRRLLPALVLVATQLLWAPAVHAASAATTTTTTTTTTISTTTTTTPTSTTRARPPLPSCREVFASDPNGNLGGGPGDFTRLLPISPPQGRRLTVVLHLLDPANSIEVRNCVSFRSSSGEELITQDERPTCCAVPAEDHRYTILLPHPPLPGTRFCAQAALRETFFQGSEDPSGFDYSVFIINRVCGVMPTAGAADQLPFTGSAHAVPLASFAALGIGVGAALLVLTTRRRGDPSDRTARRGRRRLAPR